MNLFRVAVLVLRCRTRSTEELFGQAAATPVARRTPAQPAATSVRRARAVQRLLCGFHNPLRENAVVALALRATGHPADLVVGCEPVPISGGRRLFSWLEVAGRTEGTTLPAPAFYPELWRFPAS
ncbi:hypothetical protein [Actinophytocola oryzae]|uniref:Transglutaminase superfamily protein n=1 Tax=Actinophytocola oryzae TaxID=502181 RepID=A0A4R7VKD8_9PSEU|nr:hypothetical protein [Actinophytocola oryzae]TDV49946.1 hypothetical protein CLV71_107294 [Actinophytocola oryzae]